MQALLRYTEVSSQDLSAIGVLMKRITAWFDSRPFAMGLFAATVVLLVQGVRSALGADLVSPDTTVLLAAAVGAGVTAVSGRSRGGTGEK